MALEPQLSLAVFQQAMTPILITDADTENGGPFIVAANPAFCVMTGYSLSELVGKSPKILQGQDTDPDVIAAIGQAVRTPRHANATTVNYRKDGTPYHVQWDITPIVDNQGNITHFMSMQEDISVRLQSEGTLEMMEQALRVIADAIMITDTRQRILYVNQAFTQMTGYTLEDVKGRTPDLLYTDDEETAFKLHEALTAEQAIRVRGTVRTRYGRTFHAEHSMVPVSNNDGVTAHFMSIFTEVAANPDDKERISELAATDPLTAAMTRNAGQAVLEDAHQNMVRNGVTYSLIMVDIDNFRKVNEQYGHPLGDKVLTRIASILRAGVRGNDTVVRWGGEEFLLILPGAGHDAASQLAERLREAIASTLDPTAGNITASFGFGVAWEDESVSDILNRVRDALATAKANGRNRVERA